MFKDVADDPRTGPLITPQRFGASGNGRTRDTQAVQAAIDYCAASGGGTVYVGAGDYLIAPIRLASRVTLHLAAGARLVGSDNRRDYRTMRRRYAGNVAWTCEPLIGGEDLEDAAITGQGVIDGSGAAWWKPLQDFLAQPKDQRPTPAAPPDSEEFARESVFIRPRLVEPYACRNLLIQGVTLTNSAFWTLHPMFCRDVRIDGVTIRNPDHANNSDGINPDSCRNVRISNCLIDTGDDCIALKSGSDDDARSQAMATENITIINCMMLRGHGGVVVGSDMSGGVRNVAISNCIFQGTDVGLRFKSMRGRGGVVEYVLAQNIVMDEVRQALQVDLHYWKQTQPGPVTDTTPRFRQIHISQIQARGVREVAMLHGLEELPVEGISLHHSRFQGCSGFHARHVRDLCLREVQITAEEGPALDLSDASQLDLSGLRLTPAPDQPAIRLTRCRDARVRHSTVSGRARVKAVDLVDTVPSELRTSDNSFPTS